MTISPDSSSESEPEFGDSGASSVRLCHPCLFRRTLVTASAHLSIGDHVAVFGLGLADDPTIEFFTEGACGLGPNGLVSWGFADGGMVLCFATLLPVELAMALVEANGGRSADDHESHRSGAERPATRVDFSTDDELEVTLVYAVVPGDDPIAQDAASATLTRLMATFGAEEIANDPALLAVAS